jgi:hypothetical protein
VVGRRNIDYPEAGLSPFSRVMMLGMETIDATSYLVVAEADRSATGISDASVEAASNEGVAVLPFAEYTR